MGGKTDGGADCPPIAYNRERHERAEAIQHLQGGAGPGVHEGVLHGARGAADVRAGRDAGGGGRACTVGSLRGAGLLQVHGA